MSFPLKREELKEKKFGWYHDLHIVPWKGFDVLFLYKNMIRDLDAFIDKVIGDSGLKGAADRIIDQEINQDPFLAMAVLMTPRDQGDRQLDPRGVLLAALGSEVAVIIDKKTPRLRVFRNGRLPEKVGRDGGLYYG